MGLARSASATAYTDAGALSERFDGGWDAGSNNDTSHALPAAMSDSSIDHRRMKRCIRDSNRFELLDLRY